MLTTHTGELAALATALCWTVTVMVFEEAGKKIGSLAVNFYRLIIGCLLLSVFGLIYRGMPLPTDATLHNWIWLSISGVIGLTIGDLCLFKAFIIVGARVSVLVMAFVPVISAIISWFILGETLQWLDKLGMVLTVCGVVMVVLNRRTYENRRRTRYPASGLLLAFGGAVGQAVGLVFSKYGMGDYDAFAANHIRLIAGIIGFSVLFVFLRWWPRVIAAITNVKGMAYTSIGAFFGPFVGVSLSLLAVQLTEVGVVATIIALIPIFIIPPAVILKKEPITMRDVMGALIAVSGSALLFLN